MTLIFLTTVLTNPAKVESQGPQTMNTNPNRDPREGVKVEAPSLPNERDRTPNNMFQVPKMAAMQQ